MTNPSSLLTLSGVGVTPYSARGLRQTLAHIGAVSQLKRTINGDLEDIADPIFQKYESTITGSDQDSPAFESMWPGQTITVGCIVELSKVMDTDDTQDRTPVSGSVRNADGYMFYRPTLVMKVVGWNIDTDEWDRVIGWSLNLEEV